MRCAALLLLAACGRIGFGAGTPNGDGGGDDAADGAVTPANFVFVTSTMPTPGSLGGLAGADSMCDGLASANGMPGTYRAWLSTTTIDAKDRLGQARGWVRPDGRPFADTVADLVAGIVFYPPMIEETGATFTSGIPFTVTAARPNGTRGTGGTCGDWTVPNGEPAAFGFPFGGTDEWTELEGNTQPCNSAAHVYCFGIDRQAIVQPVAPATKRRAFITRTVFVTSTGVAGADTICRDEAVAASLGGSFRAMIATPTATAASRFSTAGPPWYRVDDVEVTADLVTTLAPIDITADGVRTGGAPTLPATGAADPFMLGTVATTCNNWTSTDGGDSFLTGNADRVRGAFDFSPFPCNTVVARGVYCFEE